MRWTKVLLWLSSFGYQGYHCCVVVVSDVDHDSADDDFAPQLRKRH